MLWLLLLLMFGDGNFGGGGLWSGEFGGGGFTTNGDGQFEGGGYTSAADPVIIDDGG